MTTATRVARVARAGRAGADARRTTRRATRGARATRGDDDGDGPTTRAVVGFTRTTRARGARSRTRSAGGPREAWFAPLQASIAVALAGVVDAGYSGDWSRVGALTTEQEAWTRRFVAFVAVAHGVVGAIARDVALKRGAERDERERGVREDVRRRVRGTRRGGVRRRATKTRDGGSTFAARSTRDDCSVILF